MASASRCCNKNLQTAHLAYVMQDSAAVITDTKDAKQDCIENLEDLIQPALTNLPATKNSKKVTKKLKEIQLKFSPTMSTK